MRAVVVALVSVAACGDNLVPENLGEPSPQMRCVADVWSTNHTVTAATSMFCDSDAPVQKLAVSLWLDGELVRLRHHLADCRTSIMDTYDLEEMEPGVMASTLVENADGVVCDTRPIRLLRQ